MLSTLLPSAPSPLAAPRAALARRFDAVRAYTLVLGVASPATSAGDSRKTYRNYFPPAARWQFSGIRLAKDRT